jgi:hypothetical protein
VSYPLSKCGGGGKHRRKLAFKSEELAFRRAAFINTHGRLGSKHNDYVMHAYRCADCGWWHLNSAKLSGITPPHHVKYAQRMATNVNAEFAKLLQECRTIQPAI